MKKFRWESRYLLIALVGGLMLCLILFPDRYIVSVTNGLYLYVISVLPALFPFFFFSKLLTELGMGYDLGRLLEKPLKRLYGVPGIAGYIMVIAMLSGYPMGAKLVADCYESGLINEQEARCISTFTSTSGPLFIVGTVGIAMLSNKTAGFILLISHYLGTLLNGFLYRNRKGSEKAYTFPKPKIDTDTLLKESMLSAISSVLIVGGYIAIFNMVLDIAYDLKLIKALAYPFTFLGVNKNLSSGFFAAFIEVTKGCLILAKSGYGVTVTVPLIAFAISFGGLSVTLQNMTFLGKCKIKPAYYLLTKITQGLLSCIIALGLSFLL